MIIGAKYWNKDFYSQKNNAFELQNKMKYGEKIKVGNKTIHYTETCGPSAAINCIAALGCDLSWCRIQPEDELTCWMFTHIPELLKIRNVPQMLPNEVPQFYPYSVGELFNVKAEFKWFKNWEGFKNKIISGNTIEVCIPGHYIACVAYDDITDEIIYHDSWAGKSKRFNEEYYARKVSRWIIEYKKI